MRVRLLGTGAADGWPNAWCSCASCSWARASGCVRATTSALVDDVLLVDCGPDSPAAASRAGVSLARVETLLLTHAHADHLEPLALLARSWARPAVPLTVVGPPSALAAVRDWIGPHDDVRLHEVGDGDRLELGAHTVLVHSAAHDVGSDELARDAVIYAVLGRDGGRLLYATDTGPLDDRVVGALTNGQFDLVLLEETFGTRTDHGTGHHDLATFPREIARLRSVVAIDDSTDVVAVHLGHHNPPGDELDRRLASWGARTVPDLAEIELGADRAPHPPVPRRSLLLGGARSGKSREAERRLLAEPHVRYLATSGDRAGDPEWAARVAAHRSRRPGTWTTEETLEVADALRTAARGEHLLVDCLALWLAGRLDAARAWETEPGTAAYAETLAGVDRDVDELVRAVRATEAHVVLVSNEVGSGVVPEHASGRLYRDLLGTLNARVAAECDEVSLVVAGRVVPL
jgi:adenosylcobinamide kinase/adenosylcobinamide-phosphate guanylyltransferase